MLKILVLDLETTGLDPIVDKVLEVGWVKVQMDKSNLKVLSTGSRVVHYKLDTISHLMNDHVTKMHRNSGLLHEIEASPTSLSGVEDMIVDETSCGGWILTGNSISFDRSFIKIHMPILEKNLHYRMIDTSNYPLLKKELGLPVESLKLNAHRALNDCLMSLSLLQRTVTELNR
jgi:oligoribonuclease